MTVSCHREDEYEFFKPMQAINLSLCSSYLKDIIIVQNNFKKKS